MLQHSEDIYNLLLKGSLFNGETVLLIMYARIVDSDHFCINILLHKNYENEFS